MLRMLALTGAMVLLAAVAGCSGGDSSDQAAGSGGSTAQYCRELRSAQQELRALQGQARPPDLQSVFRRVQDLAEKAPPAVADDWAQVDTNISALEKALTEAGLGFNDLIDPQAVRGLGKERLDNLQQQLQGLAGPELQRANRAIQRHAEQECNIDLDRNNAG